MGYHVSYDFRFRCKSSNRKRKLEQHFEYVYQNALQNLIQYFDTLYLSIKNEFHHKRRLYISIVNVTFKHLSKYVNTLDSKIKGHLGIKTVSL